TLNSERSNSVNFLDLSNHISRAENNNKKSNHEVLKCYYDLGKALLIQLRIYRESHNEIESKKLVSIQFHSDLKIVIPSYDACSKRKNRSKKIYMLFSCFNINNTNEDKGRKAIEWIEGFSASTILNLKWDGIKIITEYITLQLNASKTINNHGYRIIDDELNH
ncbi:8175_t:CDS:1, partial [Racocetra persica]